MRTDALFFDRCLWVKNAFFSGDDSRENRICRGAVAVQKDWLQDAPQPRCAESSRCPELVIAGCRGDLHLQPPIDLLIVSAFHRQDAHRAARADGAVVLDHGHGQDSRAFQGSGRFDGHLAGHGAAKGAFEDQGAAFQGVLPGVA